MYFNFRLKTYIIMSENAVDSIANSENVGRFSSMIATQCQRSVQILGESTESRPLSLKDFKETLEKSLSALNVSDHEFDYIFLHDFLIIPFSASAHHEEIERSSRRITQLDDNSKCQHRFGIAKLAGRVSFNSIFTIEFYYIT